MKLKKFNNLNESHNFLSRYNDEINNAIKLLIKLQDCNNIDHNKVEQRLSVYDVNVPDKIDEWIYDTPTPQEIAEFAEKNQYRWGTEPQMVLQAIEDYAQTCNIYSFDDDDDEFEEENENVDVDNFTARYYDNYDDEEDTTSYEENSTEALKKIQMFEDFVKKNY